MKLLQIILLIIVLILSALLIAINLKLYRINDIKRGGQISEDVLINTYGDDYEFLPECDKSLFSVYLYDTIGINDDGEFNNTEGKENLLNIWIGSQEDSDDIQTAVAASLLGTQNKCTSQVEYDLWLRSSSLIRSIHPDIQKKSIEIQCTFPNFFSGIISNTIDINNLQLHNGLEVRRHGFKESNIYFDIKYTIWMYCIKNNLIHDNVENRNCFFLNAELDACDLNGWIIQSFTHTSDIYSFIIDKIGNMEKIVFIPRSDKSMSSFVKNIIFGRMETMGTTNSEKLIRARYYGSRQVFGDGNCYYTAFMFNLLEFALFSGRTNGIRQRIAKNIIDALRSVQEDIQEEILIYSRETGNNYTMPKKIMQNDYTYMLTKLANFFKTANSIFELERLFNEQNPYNGELAGICLPLVYGCKLLIAKYMVDNYDSTPEGIQTTLFDIVTKNLKYDGSSFFNKDLILQPFLYTNILRIYYDMADIINLPILAYSFKCKQLIISDNNLQHPYVNYTKYKDPYTLIERSFQLIGATNLILRDVAFHYDIVYHYSDTTIPKPIFPLYEEELIPKIDTAIVNILVYCHPKKIEKEEDHFLYSHFIHIIENYSRDKYKIYTLDIKGNSDFMVDGFSDEFITTQNNKWDIIFIPDCAGQWVENQDVWTPHRPFKIDWFLDKIPKIVNMLKKNGELYFSKIVNSDNQTQIINGLNKLGYFTSTNHFDFNGMEIVMVLVMEYSSEQTEKNIIRDALSTLSYTDLDKLIECKKKRIGEYKNSAAHAYYIGDSRRYTTEEENNKNEKILENAECTKLIISQVIEYYNMKDIVTNNTDKDRFINLLGILKVELVIDKDDTLINIINHHSGAPIISKKKVRELFLEHSLFSK